MTSGEGEGEEGWRIELLYFGDKSLVFVLVQMYDLFNLNHMTWWDGYYTELYTLYFIFQVSLETAMQTQSGNVYYMCFMT